MKEETLTKLNALKLHGMSRSFRSTFGSEDFNQYTNDDFIAMLVDAECDERENRKLGRSLKLAKFRYKASIEQVNYDNERGINRNQVHRLADCEFIKRKENLIITGSTGIGKSYLASAIGHQACALGYKVLYGQSTKLFSKMKLAKVDGSYLKELARMERQDLIIIDDFGIQPLDAQSRTILLEIMEDRHGKSSTIFTSQVPVSQWHDVIGEQTIADAILDRIIHDAHRLEMTGESMRKTQNRIQENQEK
jgi:DNA replication protein DnaC